MPVGAAPGDAAVAFTLENFPAAVRLKLVVSNTEGAKVAYFTATPVVPCDCVINLAIVGCAVAFGEAAGAITRNDQATQRTTNLVALATKV